jgi:hypothetical protein
MKDLEKLLMQMSGFFYWHENSTVFFVTPILSFKNYNYGQVRI